MCHLQPAAGCHTCALERQATVSQDWDINHTGLKKKKKIEKEEELHYLNIYLWATMEEKSTEQESR